MIQHPLKKFFTALFIASSGFPLLPLSMVYAADDTQGLGCGGGLGPIAALFCGVTPENKGRVGNAVNTLISGIILFLTIVAALWFMIQFILAGYQWISSAGDKHALETARNRMLYAFVGLVIVAASWVIMGLIGKIVGIEILNPGGVIQTINISN